MGVYSTRVGKVIFYRTPDHLHVYHRACSLRKQMTAMWRMVVRETLKRVVLKTTGSLNETTQEDTVSLHLRIRRW